MHLYAHVQHYNDLVMQIFTIIIMHSLVCINASVNQCLADQYFSLLLGKPQ